MTLLISKGAPAGRGARLAKTQSVRRPVDEEHLADQVPAGDGPPDPRVARLGPVVAHEEVVALRDLRPTARRLVVAAVRGDVRLLELDPVDVDDAVALADCLAGQADQALHERAAGAAANLRLRRRVEDDDLAPLRIAEVVDEAVREHAVAESRFATRRGLRAVERRFHRRRRDAVW